MRPTSSSRARALVAPLLLAAALPAQAAPLPNPTPARSVTPNLAVGTDGTLRLSWIEPGADEGHRLRFAARTAEGWSAPRTIAAGDDWFVNWADFPSLVDLGDGALAAHWLQKSGPDTYAYDVRLARSADGGATWGPPWTPHTDGTKTEHGFVSLLADGDGVLLAVWLDGRAMQADGHGHGAGAMALRCARVGRDGALTDEAVLDDRVCECCQTAAAMAAAGPIVVYRDRSADEVRDIHVVRRRDGAWTAPRPVVADGWKIPGCPVNGPAIAAEDARVAVAWFTAADDEARVHCAFSADDGATFGAPVRVDDGDPVGRATVLLLDGGDALVAWLERRADGGQLRARRVGPDGRRGDAVTIAPMATARRSGFPRVARTGDELVFAWTAASVRTARLPVGGLPPPR